MKAHFSTAIRPFGRLLRLAAPFGLVLSLGLGLSGPAHAVDGCKLLLCMAGNWQNISQCTSTVRQALRDVARGRAWPTCSMGGDSASGNQYVAPVQCPEQYVTNAGTDRNGRICELIESRLYIVELPPSCTRCPMPSRSVAEAQNHQAGGGNRLN